MPLFSKRANTKRSLWRKRLRMLLLAILVAALMFYTLTRPRPAAFFIAKLMSIATGAKVKIDAAQISFDGTVRLQRVRLLAPPGVIADRRLLEADLVETRHSWAKLFIGQWMPVSLIIARPTLYITQDLASRKFNFQFPGTQQDGTPPRSLPDLLLSDGRIQFGELADGQYVSSGSVRLSGTLSASPDDPGVYLLALRQESVGTTGPALTGRIDLARSSVSGRIDRLTVDGTEGNILPGHLRHWWQRLQPQGALPTVRFGYDPQPDVGVFAELELRDAAITLPFGQGQTRMSAVNGRFTIADEQIFTDLSGRIEGSDYQFVYAVTGQTGGLDLAAPFELVMNVTGTVPEKPQDVPALPAGVQLAFRRFSPAGHLQATVRIRRENRDTPPRYDGTIQLAESVAQYSKFPYPLRDLSGQLQFDEQRIQFVNLRGHGMNGGNVFIEGEIAPPTEHAAVHMTITGENVPIDDFLHQALPQRGRTALAMFLDETSHQRMVEAGLIQTSEQKQQRQDWLEQLHQELVRLREQPNDNAVAITRVERQITRQEKLAARPSFKLGGAVNAIARVERDYGPGLKTRVYTDVDLNGLNVLFTHWPYPLRLTGGRLTIEPGRFELHDVQAVGLVSGTGTIKGNIDLGPDKDKFVPQLIFHTNDMPLDELLLASIPRTPRRWLQALHATGQLDADGTIFRNDAGKVDYQINVDLAQGRAQPNGGHFHINELAGRVRITADETHIEYLHGSHEQTKLSLSGDSVWTDGQTQLDLHVNAQNMRWEDPVLDLIPSHLTERQTLVNFFAEHHPLGHFDSSLHFRTNGDDKHTYELRLTPLDLQFDWHDQTVQLRDVTGQIVVVPEDLRLDNLRAAWGIDGDSWLSATGSIGLINSAIDLELKGHCDQLDDTAQVFFPEDLRNALDKLKLHGQFDLERARLIRQPDRALSLEAQLGLHDVTAQAGVPITELTGQLSLRTVRPPDQERTRYEANLHAQHLRASTRLIENISFTIHNQEHLDLLHIDALNGQCYGGTLVGDGEIRLTAPQRCRMDLTLSDAQLSSFLHPYGNPDANTPASGLLSASLSIDTLTDQPSSRVGRGRVEISNARLHQLPLAMTVLQLMNLRLPQSSSFEQAAADYLVDGDIVLLDHVSFQARSVEIRGHGRMDYPTQALNLDLFSRSPAQSEGALRELGDIFKDALMTIHVGGTLGDPQVKVESFRGIKESWQELFGTAQASGVHQIEPLRPSTSGQ